MNSRDIRNLQEAYLSVYEVDSEIGIISELTGGKGHPGYKAGSRDLGPMQSGHPADTFKRTMKGGTMSQRHGYHLGDLDDKDDDKDDLETGLKDTARKKRENVRKPLRDKVRSARKVLSREQTDIYDIILSHLLDEGYAETIESAEAIMVNMSEDWRESIVDEAYVPLRNDDGTETDKWFRAKGKKQASVGRAANRIRHGIGNQEKNMSQLTSAAKRLGAVNQVDKESESERRRRSEAQAAANRARGG